MPWLRLIRFPNLLIIGLCQCLAAECFLWPAIRSAGLTPELDPAEQGGLAGATLFLAGAGYAYNGLRDLPADRVNRPDRPLPAGRIQQRAAGRGIVVLLTLSILTAVGTAAHTGQWNQLWLLPVAIATLFIYSAGFKNAGLAANGLIALFCAAAVALPAWAERRNLERLSLAEHPHFWILLSAFVAFAFLLTLFRELIKDLEDMEGDRVQGHRSFPLRRGAPAARRLGASLGLIGLLGLIPVWTAMHDTLPAFPWVMGGIVLISPLGVATVWLLRAKSKREYYQLSQFVKAAMLLGIAALSFFAIRTL